jgi:hypothetical protein
MNTESPGQENVKHRSKAYFILAAVFLILMALVWSVDSSLVFIFLGVASFFLFLGFYNNPGTHDINSTNKKSYQHEKRRFGDGVFPKETFKNFFGRKKTTPYGDSSMPIPGRKIRMIVMIIFFIMIFKAILSSMLDSGGRSYDAVSYYSTAEQQYLTQAYDSAYVNYKRA